MGNAVLFSSCKCEISDVLYCKTRLNSRFTCSCTRLVQTATGAVLEFSQPIKAGELMLDYPNHFVCHSSSYILGKRVLPLPSDEDLQSNHLYFLLPMQKLHTRLSHQDMAVVLAADHINRKFKHPMKALFNHGLPSPSLSRVSSSHNCDNILLITHKIGSESQAQSESILPVSKQSPMGSWRPKLQTINETLPLRSWVF